MVSRRITAGAVALALLAIVQTALSEATANCDPRTAIMCYWTKAHKFGVEVLIPVNGNETAYLKNVCASEHQLPTKPMCEVFYAECTVSEKLKFKRQEDGYQKLQQAVTDSAKCQGVEKLTGCIQKDVMKNCPAHFGKYPTSDGARRNHQAAVNLTICLNESLMACAKEEFSNATKYIQSIARALPLLYWPEKHYTPTPAPATTELPSSTPVSTEPTSETSPTTEKTVPTSEQTTEPVHPTETTTPQPETTTNQPSSSEPATTSPTETPTPATTPKPSGAATSVPFVGTLMFISAIWLAQAA